MTTKTKPETLPLEEKEETLYAPLTVKRIFKKPFVAYIRKSPLKVLNKMALNESEYDTLRAAQDAFMYQQGTLAFQNGMAQGKKEAQKCPCCGAQGTIWICPKHYTEMCQRVVKGIAKEEVQKEARKE